MHTSDERLMLQLQCGSSDAFSELFLRYRQPIYGFFRRRLENPARAEELAQDTFTAVLAAAARYEPRATFRTYLYGIAFHLLMAERRKLHRERTQSVGSLDAVAPADPVAASPTENPVAALWVKRALEQLDPQEREIVLLREYEGLSYAEVAALLRVPVNTVRSRLFRARAVLKDLLAPQPRPGAIGETTHDQLRNETPIDRRTRT